jgi:hypothetical protein
MLSRLSTPGDLYRLKCRKSGPERIYFTLGTDTESGKPKVLDLSGSTPSVTVVTQNDLNGYDFSKQGGQAFEQNKNLDDLAQVFQSKENGAVDTFQYKKIYVSDLDSKLRVWGAAARLEAKKKAPYVRPKDPAKATQEIREEEFLKEKKFQLTQIGSCWSNNKGRGFKILVRYDSGWCTFLVAENTGPTLLTMSLEMATDLRYRTRTYPPTISTVSELVELMERNPLFVARSLSNSPTGRVEDWRNQYKTRHCTKSIPFEVPGPIADGAVTGAELADGLEVDTKPVGGFYNPCLSLDTQHLYPPPVIKKEVVLKPRRFFGWLFPKKVEIELTGQDPLA